MNVGSSEAGTVERAPTKHTARMSDGTELLYRAWLPPTPTDKALLLFHRGHEHSGRFQDVVEALGFEDVALFAWDARGHGESPGERGYSPSLARSVRDVDEFVQHVSETHTVRIEDMVVLAHSVGAVTVAAWVHDYAPRIRGMLLVTPAFRVKLYIPFALAGLRLLQKISPNRRHSVKSYVKAKMLTHDEEQARRYTEDPLIARSIAVNVLIDLHDTATRLLADAGAIRVPTALLSGGADWVVKVPTQERFFDDLGSTDKRMKVFPGLYHDLLHERDREPVLAEIRKFVEDRFAADDELPPLLDADKRGYTFDEHAALARPLSPLSPKRILFALTRLSMATVGRLSGGIKVGWETGFDSGRSLDYVYENQARGGLLIGRWIDRAYLDSVGWAGIRTRKVHLEELIQKAVQQAVEDRGEAHLVDIAAGAGRYLLDVLGGMKEQSLTALLRDWVQGNLDVGAETARKLRLENVRFEQGDAFDEASLAALDPKPDVAVVSGLYELFPSNDGIRASLRGLAAAVRPGGYLVYTCQPWHPQLEFIARVLPNRDGEPWIMRRRTQGEMDDLVRAAGFRKVTMRIDRWGIFTVSLAQRES